MKTTIGIVIAAGAGFAIWYYYFRPAPTKAPSTQAYRPQQIPGGDFYATPIARTRPADAPILGYAVPRTTTTGTGGQRGANTTTIVAPTSIAVNYGAWGNADEETIEDGPIFYAI
jgi:hypothetical protein